MQSLLSGGFAPPDPVAGPLGRSLARVAREIGATTTSSEDKLKETLRDLATQELNRHPVRLPEQDPEGQAPIHRALTRISGSGFVKPKESIIDKGLDYLDGPDLTSLNNATAPAREVIFGSEDPSLGQIAATAALFAAGPAGLALRGTRAGTAIARAARPAARVAGPALRHPIKTVAGAPFALQAPATLASGDVRGNLDAALEGTGVAGSLAAGVGDAIKEVIPGIAGNILKDALNLPAQALPSVYLPAAAIVEAAAKGDTDRASKLLSDYAEAGIIPHLVRGDIPGALEAIQEHPLFTALQASGAYALIGRGVGTAARSGRLGPERQALAQTERDPLHMYGNRSQPRRYSRNYYTGLLQRRGEQRQRDRGDDPKQATPAQVERYIRGFGVGLGEHFTAIPGEGLLNRPTGAIHRFVDDRMVKAREDRERIMASYGPKAPEYGGVMAEIVQGSVRRPETFHADLRTRRNELEAMMADRGPDALTQQERASVKQSLEAVEKALRLREGDPRIERLFEDAATFERETAPLQEQMGELGLLDPESVATARFYPLAIRHGGGRHGRPDEVEAEIAQIEADVAELRTRRDETDSATEKAKIRDALAELQDRHTALRADHPEGLIGPTGERFGPDDLAELAQGELGRMPGFLTHRPGWRGRGSFHQPFTEGRGRLPGHRRSGEAFRRGSYDDSWHALVEQHVYAQTALTRARAYDDLMEHFGVTKANGESWVTFREAEAVADSPADSGYNFHGIEMVPVHRAPMRALAREMQGSRRPDTARGQVIDIEHADVNLIDPETGGWVNERIARAIERAFEPGTGTGDVVLVPEPLKKALIEYGRGTSQESKLMQSLTQGFKNTVLPYSPSWLKGNVFEVSMRSLLAGIGLGQPGTSLGHRALSKQFLEMVESVHGPAVRQTWQRRIAGGQHIGTLGQNKDFRTDAHVAGRAFNRLLDKPVASSLYRMHRAYTNFIYRYSAEFERNAQLTGHGKIARQEIGNVTRSWRKALKFEEAALREWVERNGKDVDVIDDFAFQVEEIFGRWGKNSPAARRALTTYAPFWMWARSATRFAFVTLPKKHPAKLALLSAANEMTQEERRAFGLDLFGPDPVSPFLQGGLPGADGILKTSNLSTFGIFGDYPTFLSRLLLPQIRAVTDTFSNREWTGASLNIDDPRARVALAIASQAEAVVPVLAIVKRLVEGSGAGEFFGFPRYGGEKLDFLRTAEEITITDPDEGGDIERRQDSGSDSSSSSESGSSSDADYYRNLGSGSSSDYADYYGNLGK